MRFRLSLNTPQIKALLPFNYQYPLSAAIYKIIEQADIEFTAFLHDFGYGNGGKKFKLFTFSDIRTPFVRRNDRMLLTTQTAELVVCFYVPKAAETFIKGLFANQQLEIADKGSKVVFTVVDLKTAITHYSDMSATPRAAIAGRKTSNANLKALRTIRKAFAILDDLMPGFQEVEEK